MLLVEQQIADRAADEAGMAGLGVERLQQPLDPGPDHPLTVTDTPDGPSPRVAVRFGLEAELARPLYYELADIALAVGHDPPGIWSDGAFFAMVP